MASTTKVKKIRKVLKAASRAHRRKNALLNKGSTAPDLPLNMPNAAEKAAKKAKAPA